MPKNYPRLSTGAPFIHVKILCAITDLNKSRNSLTIQTHRATYGLFVQLSVSIYTSPGATHGRRNLNLIVIIPRQVRMVRTSFHAIHTITSSGCSIFGLLTSSMVTYTFPSDKDTQDRFRTYLECFLVDDCFHRHSGARLTIVEPARQ
jgi:hypothetical protein